MIDSDRLIIRGTEHGNGVGWSAWSLQARVKLSALLVLVAGCGGDGGIEPLGELPEDPTPTPVESDSLVVPAEGGTFAALDGDVELRIPQGALGAATTITVARDASADASGRAVPGGVLDFAPDGLVFDEPVELTVHLDPTRLSEVPVPELVRLHRFVDGEPLLVPGSRLDREEAAVRGFIEGFSAYGGAEAVVREVLEADRELANQADAFDEEAWRRFQSVVLEDVETVLPLIENDCRAATFLNVKASFYVQRAYMAELTVFMELDSSLVPSREAFCGGLLAPGASSLTLEPALPLRLVPGEEVLLTASVVGPQGERLFGEMLWAIGDAQVAEIDGDSGLLRALAPGTSFVGVSSVDFPLELLTQGEVVVATDLLVEIEPPELVLATGQRLPVLPTVTDTVTGRVLGPNEVSVWSIIDDAAVVTSVSESGVPDNTITLEGREPGTTAITVCVSEIDGASGSVASFQSCAEPAPVEVVYSVAGAWVIDETLTVELDPPATEICDIVGNARLEQEGTEVTGTASEQATCTFDPGDGSEPEVVSFTTEARIFQGAVSDRFLEFVTELTLPGGVLEQCRWTGLFDGVDGVALVAIGFIQCLDEDGFFSEGPSEGRRLGSG